MDMAEEKELINVYGARVHNLKNIDVEIDKEIRVDCFGDLGGDLGGRYRAVRSARL